MSEWVTYEQADDLYAADRVALRQLVWRGAVRTKRVGRTQYFHTEDLDHVLGTSVEQRLDPKGWATYTDLYRFHGIKRGWLDALVKVELVAYEVHGGEQVYHLSSVLRWLGLDPEQRKMRR